MASLIAIVICGYQFAHGEPGSKKALAGDKNFWVVDIVGNFCFVHPAKTGINSNLNIITDKGNIYSFMLQDVSQRDETPDLKVIVVPADQSSIPEATPQEAIRCRCLRLSKLASLQP
ncbi:MAG: TrbG/VirB9 family P-type conjugative transfer protein [Acidobacteriaceae bacterium]